MKTRLKRYSVTVAEETFLKQQKKNLVLHVVLSLVLLIVIDAWFVIGLALGLEAGQIMIHAQYNRENLLEGYISQQVRIWDLIQDLVSWVILPILAMIV